MPLVATRLGLRPDARHGFRHLNVVLPDLPDPHRFLATAVMVGQSGTAAFDADHTLAGSGPRRTVTLAHGTAASAPDGFHVFDAEADCSLAPDRLAARLGDVLEPETLLLLTSVRALGRRLLATAIFASPTTGIRRPAGAVALACGPPGPVLTAPDGRRTAIPSRFAWAARRRGTGVLALRAVPDTATLYGIGSGWIGGAGYTGVVRGRRVDARGYFEYAARGSG